MKQIDLFIEINIEVLNIRVFIKVFSLSTDVSSF